MTDRKSPFPNALEKVDSWRAERKRLGHLLIALDFDGTISPIVARPQDAEMLGSARLVIAQLLKRPDTDIAIVSGRSLADIKERSGIAGLYYSGNHGLQIDGPGVHETREEAVRLQPRVRAIARRLERDLAGIPGVYFEDKGLTLSVHSRTIEDEHTRAEVQRIVEETHAGDGAGLRLTYGKRVVEIRPDVAWHKGKATLFMIDRISAVHGKLFPLFIGDDVTDEDAFGALQGIGEGVLVADAPPAHTAATAYVRDTDEVVRLLEAFTRD